VAPARSSATSSPSASSGYPRTPEIGTIAFDLDGTLSDWEAGIRRTEPEHGERLLEVLDPRHPRRDGHYVDHAHYLLFVEGEEIWAEVLGTSDGAAAAAQRFMDAFTPVPYPEADATLAALAERHRLALVTNNPRAEAELALLGLGRHVDAVVSLPPELRKPRVEGFHHAAERLGVAPAELTYVGDSYRCDVEAGLAAGVRPIWVDRWDTGLPVPDGVVRVTSLDALVPLLA
jgi:HAD superfamily hydrolase (TIGR01509 family)